MNINVRIGLIPTQEQVINLNKAVEWSAAKKPDLLYRALGNSHTLVTAWVNDSLVGISNAITDGHLVVDFPHLLVSPSYQQLGIGRMMMMKMSEVYNGFHMQMLTADAQAYQFYLKLGFDRIIIYDNMSEPPISDTIKNIIKINPTKQISMLM